MRNVRAISEKTLIAAETVLFVFPYPVWLMLMSGGKAVLPS